VRNRICFLRRFAPHYCSGFAPIEQLLTFVSFVFFVSSVFK
jgi:hypothetical protein